MQNITCNKHGLITMEDYLGNDLLESHSYTQSNEERIVQIIDKGVKNFKTLLDIENQVKSEFDGKLGDVTQGFIDRTYGDQLIQVWNEESLKLFKSLTSEIFTTRNQSDFQKFIEDFGKVSSFQECYNFFDESMYSPLIAGFVKVSRWLKTEETLLVNKLKYKCLLELKYMFETIKDEFYLLHGLAEVLKLKNIEKTCKLLLLDNLTNCSDATEGFKSFLIHVLSLKCDPTSDSVSETLILHRLQSAVRKNINKNTFFLINDFNNLIHSFLKPVEEPQETLQDGRFVLEIKGVHLVFSQILPKIESNTRFSQIEEVRFVGAAVIYVDADLKAEIWHGKNIVVVTDDLVICKDSNYVWDVSGKDAETSQWTEPAGQAPDGSGLKGADGSSGESGGNVCLIVKVIKNDEHLTIKSLGGKGSRGQEGGKGADGRKGQSLTDFSFGRDFPPVAKLNNNSKVERLQRTLSSISETVAVIERCMYGNSELNCPMGKVEFDQQFVGQNTDLQSMYVEATTTEGFKITFSFFFEAYKMSICQAYILHEGSEGEEGKNGGMGGFGGQRGFSGDIEIPNQDQQKISRICKDVGKSENLDGKPGEWGKPGSKGADLGYLDSAVYNPKLVFSGKKFPKRFSSSNENFKLTLNFEKDSSSERVWCHLNNSYCTITEVSQSERKSQKHTMQQSLKCVQREQQAQRKKTISKREMKAKYDKQESVSSMSTVQDTLDEMLTQLEETIKSTQNVSTSFKVRRQMSYFFKSWSTFDSTQNKFNSQEETSEECENQKALVSFQHQTVSQSTSFQSPVVNNVSNRLEPVPCNARISPKSLAKNEKKIEVLRQLQNTLSNKIEYLTSISQTVHDFIETKALSTVEDSLNKVEQFLVEDSSNNRLRIVELSKKLRSDPLLSELLVMFVDEFNTGSISFQLELDDECLQAIQYTDLMVTNFKANKAKSVSSRLVPIQNELLQDKGLIKQKLTQSIMNDGNHHETEFENKVSESKLLSALHKNFIKQKNLKFDLDEIPDELLSSVLQAFYLCLEKIGPMSISCREFVSKHFKTNILVYMENQDSFELVYNHNPRSLSKVHILMKMGKFFKLRVDSKMNELTHHHKTLSTLFNKVLINIDALGEIHKLEGYLIKTPFSSKDFLSETNSFKNESFRVKITNVIEQDEDIKTISNSFETTEDKLLIASRLEKLKLEYIGYEATLHHMAAHFSVEGNHLSTKELCSVINLVLKSALDSSKTSKLVSLIIAIYPQTQWLIEIALLRFQVFLKQVLNPELKTKWRGYLSDQSEKENLLFLLKRINEENTHVSVECFGEILFLFSNIPTAHVGLDKINMLEWKYYLKDKYFANKVNSITDWSNDQLKELSFIFMTLENKIGLKMCERILDMMQALKEPTLHEFEKTMVIRTLKTIASSDVCFDEKVLDKLSVRNICDWENVVKQECLNNGEERSLENLFNLINASENTSKNILNQSQDIHDVAKNCISLINCLSKTGNNEEKKYVYKEVKKLFPSNKSADEEKQIGDGIDKFIQSNNCDELVKHMVGHKLNSTALIPLVAKVIEMKMNKKLKLTQIVTIVTMLKNGNNTLAQVSTGEGKTLIVVVLSIIQALFKNRVSVITSSKVLAVRDAEAYKEIFNYFGIEVGHNCSEDLEERKKVYSSCKVVYGELGNFQRDFLLDRFHNKNIRGDFALDVVVVDEVDSMLLDKAGNILYLAHDIPGLNTLESIFIHIWKWLNNPQRKEGIDPLVDSAMLKTSIMFDIFGMVGKECIRDFVNPKCEEIVSTTWEFLIKQKVIDIKGKVLVENMSELEKKVDSLPNNCLHVHHLNFLFKRVFDREKLFHIPNYLKPFVEEHVENWIRSGVNALVMQSGKNYVVDVDRSGNGTERNPNIIILDQSTGTDLFNSQWDEALHQFLQLKHGCKLSLLSLKAVYISNVSYLKLYKTLYGLSGTLGSQRERDLLKEIYEKESSCLDFVTIPTAKAKRFTEYLPILSSYGDWGSTIKERALHEINNKRSVLIVCESVNDVSCLKEYFPNLPVHTYTRDYEELTVAKNIKPGHIIIATNLAGRGTDILISKTLEDAGGLHEILAYFPDNFRTGEQAYGRVARNGQPGSAQMIVRVDEATLCRGTTQYFDLKKQRDVDEIKRLSEVKSYYKSQIEPEENWLVRFEKLYEKLRKDPLDNFFKSTKSFLAPATSVSSSMPFDRKSSLQMETEQDDVRYVLLQTCLNEWAFWLDRNSRRFSVKESDSELEQHFEQLSSTCEALCSENFDNCLKFIKDPCQLIKLGLVYLDKKTVLSIKLFDKVIEEEPLFSEIALYYRACARTMNQDLEVISIIADLEAVSNKLKNLIQSAALKSSLIDWMKEYNPSSILQIESFKEQQLNIGKIYNIFLESIHNMIGSEVSSEMFTLNPEDHQFALNIFNDLIYKGILKKHTLSDNISEEDLRFAWKYYISPPKMMQLLGPLKGKDFSETSFFKIFEQMLPSRELFWDELKRHDILVDEKEYALLLMQEIEVLEPSLIPILNNFDNEEIQEKYIHLYDCQSAIDQDRFRIVGKETLERLVGNHKMQFLQYKSAIFLNKKAKFSNCTDKLSFGHFDSINQHDLVNIGIQEEIAIEILDEMESLGMIKRNKSEKFSLEIHSENIENLHLPKHNAYNEEVKSLMEFHFAFRIAFEKIQLLSENFDSFVIPLHASLHKLIIKDLDENNLIKKPTVVTDKNVSKIVSNMYPSSMLKTEVAELLKDQFGEKSKLIVTALIRSNWLTGTTATKWNKKYSVNLNAMDQRLQGEFENESLTVAAILSNYHRSTIKFQEYKEAVIKVLEKSKGSLHTINTPKLVLTPLCDALLKANIPVTELPLFSLNGFDQLLILEEKKWTWKMQTLTFCIVAFGLAQVALGVACEMSVFFAPWGTYLISEGVSDLIFAGTCAVTGNCTWRSYAQHKLISLVFTIVYAAASIYKALRGSFGENIASNISFDTVKNYIKKVGSEAKASWNSVVTASNTVKKEAIKTIVREVAIHSVKATARGVATAALYSQLDNLGDFLAEVIYSNINKMINEHTVSNTILQVRQTFCERDSERLITDKYIRCINTHRDELESTFKNIIELLKTTLSFWLSPQTLQNRLKQDNMFHYNLFSILGDAQKAITDCLNLYRNQFEIVNNTMDDLENELQTSIQQAGDREVPRPTLPDQQVLNEFQSKTVKVLKEEMTKIFSDQLKFKVITPVLDYTANILISRSSQNSVLNSNLKPKEIEAERLKKMQDIYRDIEGNPKSKAKRNQPKGNDDFDNFNYNENLLELFKTQHNVPIFSEILRTNLVVDSNFLETFCSVVPLALKKEGINFPGFQLVIERDGIQHTISTRENLTVNIPTVVIAPDASVITNITKNKFLVMEVFDAIHSQLSETYPILKEFNIESFRSTVAKAIEEDTTIQEQMTRSTKREIKLQEINTMNKLSELRHPYQRKTWKFSPAVDVDLREDKEPTISIKSENDILKGFKTALAKINQKIYNHLKRPLELVLDDFFHSKYEITLQRNQSSTSNFDCFVSEYVLAILLPIHTDKKLEKFIVSMRLVNHSTALQPGEPMGPHILYEVSPVDMKLLQQGVRGHVLLPLECLEKTFSVETCHSTGDLILPTPQLFVLGDSTLKKIKGGKCCYKKHGSITQLRKIWESLAGKIKEFQSTVVVHIGTSVDIENLPPEHIVNQIADLLLDMKTWQVRIAIIGFTHGKSCNTANVEMLNKQLQDFCTVSSIEYWCPSRIFKHKYLETDGSLSKEGCKKIITMFSKSLKVFKRKEEKSVGVRWKEVYQEISELD